MTSLGVHLAIGALVGLLRAGDPFSFLGPRVRSPPGRHYLVYLNRTGVDLLGGLFGPVKRAVLESRLRSEVPEIIVKLRGRLERTAALPTAR